MSSNQAYRLLVTELARVQTDARMRSFKKNGFDQFTFHALATARDLCLELNGKHFDVEDGESGKNMPPMHPHCLCSTSAYMDDEDYEGWLDGYKEHGLTWEEWRNSKVSEKGNSYRAGSNDVNLNYINSSAYRKKI